MTTGLAAHERPRKLVVVGQGYVGLPLAMAAVEAAVAGKAEDDHNDRGGLA